VVSLIGGYFAGIKGKISKEDLSKQVPIAVDKAAVEGKPQRQQRKGASWTFVDDNPSTHLIRNALGGGDELSLRQLLSIPAPYSRRFRDDITVTVVWWEKGNEGNPNVSTLSGPTQSVKAKL
jgi:pyruvate dehydrogenase phosphatase